jgi:hypothetical protein
MVRCAMEGYPELGSLPLELELLIGITKVKWIF